MLAGSCPSGDTTGRMPLLVEEHLLWWLGQQWYSLPCGSFPQDGLDGVIGNPEIKD